MKMRFYISKIYLFYCFELTAHKTNPITVTVLLQDVSLASAKTALILLSHLHVCKPRMSDITVIANVSVFSFLFDAVQLKARTQQEAQSSVCFLRLDNAANCIILVHMVRHAADETL